MYCSSIVLHIHANNKPHRWVCWCDHFPHIRDISDRNRTERLRPSSKARYSRDSQIPQTRFMECPLTVKCEGREGWPNQALIHYWTSDMLLLTESRHAHIMWRRGELSLIPRPSTIRFLDLLWS